MLSSSIKIKNGVRRRLPHPFGCSGFWYRGFALIPRKASPLPAFEVCAQHPSPDARGTSTAHSTCPFCRWERFAADYRRAAATASAIAAQRARFASGETKAENSTSTFPVKLSTTATTWSRPAPRAHARSSATTAKVETVTTGLVELFSSVAMITVLFTVFKAGYSTCNTPCTPVT